MFSLSSSFHLFIGLCLHRRHSPSVPLSLRPSPVSTRTEAGAAPVSAARWAWWPATSHTVTSEQERAGQDREEGDGTLERQLTNSSLQAVCILCSFNRDKLALWILQCVTHDATREPNPVTIMLCRHWVLQLNAKMIAIYRLRSVFPVKAC